VRPSGSASGAAQIDTSLFRVEFNSVPEPSVFALAGLGALGLAMKLRRSRR
jgi:PEP-CTERM motif